LRLMKLPMPFIFVILLEAKLQIRYIDLAIKAIGMY
jgi:hypothetical protein